MGQTIHVALARVFRSQSCYGNTPFTVPRGSPLELTSAIGKLVVHFGTIPEWICKAEGRRPLIAEAMLKAWFENEPTRQAELDGELSNAPSASLLEKEHKWAVTAFLHTTCTWDDGDLRNAPWCWWTTDKLRETHRNALAQTANLDLAIRVLEHFTEGAFDEESVSNRVYVSRDDAFSDALAVPRFSGGSASLALTRDISRIETTLAEPALSVALRNALAAPAVLKDTDRIARLAAAVSTDRFADSHGSFGRYELLRELQPALMRAPRTVPWRFCSLT